MAQPKTLILDNSVAPASSYAPAPIYMSGVGTVVTANKAAFTAVTSTDAAAVTSTDAAAAPTKAEFDALRADFLAVRTNFIALRADFIALKNAVIAAGLSNAS